LINCLQVGGPFWDVPLGRKDSVTASPALSDWNLPTPDENLLSIISKFLYQDLSVTDMVALAGLSLILLTLIIMPSYTFLINTHDTFKTESFFFIRNLEFVWNCVNKKLFLIS
jgi:hypothetical protein